MKNINKIPTQSEYESREFISPSLNKVVETDTLHWDSTSDRLTSGVDEKVLAIELYEVVNALPATGEYNKIYLLQDPASGLYRQYGWIDGVWVYYGTNEGTTPPVSSLTQAEYDALVSTSAVSANVLYNITDAPTLNTDNYQKKLVAGDFIRIDNTTNTIDCTLDQNLYIIVDVLPPTGIENKIYLVKKTLGDGTVVFVQYAWNVNGDNKFTEYGNTGTVSVKGGSGVSVSTDAVVDVKTAAPLKFDTNTSGVTVDTGRGVQIINNALEAKPGEGLKFDGTSAMTVNAGSGISISNSAVTANKGDGITFNASSALTVQAASGISVGANGVSVKYGNGLGYSSSSAITAVGGSGVTINANGINTKLAAPLKYDSNSAITVSSSNTYDSTGTELFTRAGAYNLYTCINKSVTVAFTSNTSYTQSVEYKVAYRIFPNAPYYYVIMAIKVKALSANNEVALGQLKVNGSTPNKRQSMSGQFRDTTKPVGILWSGVNLYVNPAFAIGNGDTLDMMAFVAMTS